MLVMQQGTDSTSPWGIPVPAQVRKAESLGGLPRVIDTHDYRVKGCSENPTVLPAWGALTGGCKTGNLGISQEVGEEPIGLGQGWSGWES